jgi:hypothetical protein
MHGTLFGTITGHYHIPVLLNVLKPCTSSLDSRAIYRTLKLSKDLLICLLLRSKHLLNSFAAWLRR